MFQHSNWITPVVWDQPTRYTGHEAYLLRREFVLTKPVQSAKLFICGLGLGEYYVNGERVTDCVLMPPYSRYDVTTYYNVFDITASIRTGVNVLGAMLGNGMYNDVNTLWEFDKAPWRDIPKLVCELHINYQDGTTDLICSDKQWKGKKAPIIFNHARAGETYDARLESSGWADADCDDSSWLSPAICRGPGGDLKEMGMPPICVVRTLSMTEISKTDAGTIVYDAGENISGWVRITLSGKIGHTVTLRYAERLDQTGGIDAENINLFNDDTPVRHTDTYILKGEGVEVWEPRFVYHGFRYVEVINGLENIKLEARVAHTALDIIGDFACSDDMLNQIHKASCRSTLCNYHGLPTDCPHREQNGWTGDAALSAEQALLNFDMIESYAKWLGDIIDCQRTNGQIPGIAPTGGWGFNWGSGPAWDSALILIPGYVYNSTGSARLITQCWVAMEKYMSFIHSMADNHIVCFGLGDWCPPANAVICDTALTDTAYYYVFAKEMSHYADIIGKDGTQYEKLAISIRTAWRKRFLTCEGIVTESQTAWACAIYQGLLDEDEIPDAAARLAHLVKAKDNHIDCGILGTKYVFTALAENGYQDVLYKMVTNPTCPSYAWWMLNGMTTLCEDWEMRTSLNHHMFSEVDHWLYKYVAGIRFDTPGYESVHIEPMPIAEVSWVRAHHRGISVEWNEKSVIVDTLTPGVLIIDGHEVALEIGHNEYLRGTNSLDVRG